MDDPPPRLRVEVVQGRNVFPSILCEVCDRLPTQHRCLHEVMKDGYIFEGMLVCGLAICALCSSKYGNEGVFRCEKHSSQLYVGGKQPSKPAESQQPDLPKRKGEKQSDPPKKKASKERGAEYTAVEILLLSRAWISASENTLMGVSQKLTTFWDSVFKAYNTFKQQHEEYIQRQKARDSFRQRNLRNNLAGLGFDSSDDTDDEATQLPARNVGSLQQKWSKKIQPLVFKFIGVTNRYPKRSGEDREAYYNRIHIIFLKENEGEKSFDVYRPSWEYLKDKPKFAVSCAAPSRSREIITLDDDADSSVKTKDEVAEKFRPMGRNSMKRKLQEEKILESVSKKIAASSSTTKSADLTKALEQIASSVSTALTSWNLQQALNNCSSDLLREYNDTIVKQHIQLLRESNQNAARTHPNITPMQLSSTYNDETTPELSVAEKENEVKSNDNDDVISDSDESEVPGTLLH